MMQESREFSKALHVNSFLSRLGCVSVVISVWNARSQNGASPIMNSLLSSIISQLVQSRHDDGNFRGIWLWRVPCRAQFQVHYLLYYTYSHIRKHIGEDSTRVLLFIATDADAAHAVLNNAIRDGRSLFPFSRKRLLLISYYKSIISLLLIAKTSSHLHRPRPVFDSLYYV